MERRFLIIVPFEARFHDKINAASNTYRLTQIVTEHHGEEDALVCIESIIGLNGIRRRVLIAVYSFVRSAVRREVVVHLFVVTSHGVHIHREMLEISFELLYAREILRLISNLGFNNARSFLKIYISCLHNEKFHRLVRYEESTIGKADER